MLLAIDTGNTNIVFAVFNDDGTVAGEWRLSTAPERTADEFGVWFDQLLAQGNISRKSITEAIIATVVPTALFNLKTFCRKYLNVDPLVIGDAGVELGIDVLVDHAEEVGADRLVNAVAAAGRYGGPMIVVDFGTATTFDVIDANGNYAGGVIAPGIHLSLDALHLAAAKLPRIAITKPEKVIGTSTVSAMQSGIYWGYVAMIEGVVARIREEFGSKMQDMQVIATGGLAHLFADATDVIERADTDLTLHGLYTINRMNRT